MANYVAIFFILMTPWNFCCAIIPFHNYFSGRGRGPGRKPDPKSWNETPKNVPTNLRHETRLAQRTSTGQGCTIYVLSVKGIGKSKYNPESGEMGDGDGGGSEDDSSIRWEQVAYHLGWYAGLSDIQYCQMLNPQPQERKYELPQIPTHCRQDNAIQGSFLRPTNIPLQEVNRHFLSCVDPRSEYFFFEIFFQNTYAILGTPGGDAGEFIRAIMAIERLLYRFIDYDEIDYLFKKFLTEMTKMGKHYFYMCSDDKADKKLKTKLEIPLDSELNPLDAEKRLDYLRFVGDEEYLGDVIYGRMVKDYKPVTDNQEMMSGGVKEYVRPEITQGFIQSFHGIRTNWFDPLRGRLLYVKLKNKIESSVEKADAVVKIVSPESCGKKYPLIVPRLHTVMPTGAGEIYPVKSDATTKTIGTSISVYHYIAANEFRMTLARFFAAQYEGLLPLDIAAKMNWLGDHAFEKEMEARGDPPEYTATFWN